MLRAVLDTNVLVSGIFFKGTPGAILDAWIDGRVQLVASPDIIGEYARVIEELGVGRQDFLALEWMDNLATLCHLIPDPIKAARYCRDPHDDKFIACALSSKAQYLVSGDRDLTSLETNFPFKIVAPKAFHVKLFK